MCLPQKLSRKSNMKWRSKIASTIFNLLGLTFETYHFQRRLNSITCGQDGGKSHLKETICDSTWP